MRGGERNRVRLAGMRGEIGRPAGGGGGVGGHDALPGGGKSRPESSGGPGGREGGRERRGRLGRAWHPEGESRKAEWYRPRP